jgi:hypothetical protein
MFHATDSHWQFQHLISHFPAIARKCDCAPISPHSSTPLYSFNAILRQRSAKINASRLQKGTVLLRLITSDKCSSSSRRISSLNKPDIIGNRSTLSSCYAPRCDAGNAQHYTKQAATLARHNATLSG